MKTAVDRLKLVDTLTANRAKFTKDLDTARVRWQAKTIDLLEKALEAVKADRVPGVINNTVPQDLTYKYDRLIAQLNESIESTIDLTQEEYKLYMLDELRLTFGSDSLKYFLE